MWISETILYYSAKVLGHTSISCSSKTREAVKSQDKFDTYRIASFPGTLKIVKSLGIDIQNKILLDFGCNDGALTYEYSKAGVEKIIGIDIDRDVIARAKRLHTNPKIEYCLSENNHIPLEDNTVDVIISQSVFEHVLDPENALKECYRLLKPGGKMVIGTWGWYHPFAPHLFTIFPVPWAHVFFSEKTIMRVCRRIYASDTYEPTMTDVDEHGQKKKNKYLTDKIGEGHLNKLLIRDFERIFKAARFKTQIVLVPFGSWYAKWTKFFTKIPFLKEFFTGYFWAVLQK